MALSRTSQGSPKASEESLIIERFEKRIGLQKKEVVCVCGVGGGWCRQITLNCFTFSKRWGRKLIWKMSFVGTTRRAGVPWYLSDGKAGI